MQEEGELDKAKPLFEQALEIDKKAYGSDHPEVALGLNNLASLLRELGELDKAKPLLEQALEIWKKAHGSDHPSVATGLNNLALLLK